MSELWSALDYHATAEQIVDSAGNILAQREQRHGIKALVLSRTIVDATGRPLLKVLPRKGQITARVDVFTPQDEPIAHIKGTAFLTRPRKFTIRDGSGSLIGRIEGTWIGWEFRLLDNEGRMRAHGVKTGLKDGTEWAVEIQDGRPLASPWPELTAAFFLARRALEMPRLPP